HKGCIVFRLHAREFPGIIFQKQFFHFPALSSLSLGCQNCPYFFNGYFLLLRFSRNRHLYFFILLVFCQSTVTSGQLFIPFREGLINFRSEEHTSELQSRFDLVCRLLLEKKNVKYTASNKTNHN